MRDCNKRKDFSSYGEEDYVETVREYYNEQQIKKERDKAFSNLKADFSGAMDELFSQSQYKDFDKIDFAIFLDDEDHTRPVGGTYTVTKVQPSTVVFDYERLRKRLDSDTLSKVVTTEVLIDDFDGLRDYVRSLGGDPTVFKSFLKVSHDVNAKELNRLSETGDVTPEMIEGCYRVEYKNPYYRVSFRDDDE